MAPTESASRRAFWQGFVVGLGLRYFAVAIFFALFAAASQLRLSEAMGWIVWTPLIICGLSSPLVIPFLAGFASAYFWRRVTWRDEHKDKSLAIWLSALLFLPFHLLLIGCCLLLSLPIDYALCESGVQRGTQFWNGRSGRQFVGDFSTRDEDEERH